MIYLTLTLLALAAGFGGLAWGYFVLGPRERSLAALSRAFNRQSRTWIWVRIKTEEAENSCRQLAEAFRRLSAAANPDGR